MRAFGLAVVAATITLATAAADQRFDRSLQMLAPAERLEQLCDYTAITRIRTEKKEFRSRSRGGQRDGRAKDERRYD